MKLEHASIETSSYEYSYLCENETRAPTCSCRAIADPTDRIHISSYQSMYRTRSTSLCLFPHTYDKIVSQETRERTTLETRLWSSYAELGVYTLLLLVKWLFY